MENLAHAPRCLRIVHTVSSLKVGGMEQFVVQIADAQQRRGHQATILALQGGPLLAQAQDLGLHVRVLGGAHKIPRVLKGLFALQRLRPDIIHAHNPTSLHYAILGKRLSHARLVLTRHGQAKEGIKASQWPYLDAVIAVSAATSEVMRKDSGAQAQKIQVLHNGIQPSPQARSRAEIRAELGVDKNVVGIIVARIDGLKGHETLIRALASLPEGDPPVTLLIVGDGAKRVELESLAQQLGLGPERVRFLGFRADVPDLLAASDLFVLPSLTEGLPLSVLEAMVHRLPIVATPVGGIPELVPDDRHGILVPVNDVAALAQAISQVASDPPLRAAMGEAVYRRAMEVFSFDAMVGKYDDLYSRLCAGI